MFTTTTYAQGHIHLITGPMFAGKTSELLRLTTRYALAGKKVVLVKHTDDDRFTRKAVCTHDRLEKEAISGSSLREVLDIIDYFDVVGVEEGHFFPDIGECADLLASKGKIVVIAALDGDYKRKPFPAVVPLMGTAEKVDKLSAVCCKCGNFASFTHRTAAVDSPSNKVIGGAETYKAVCRTCYNALTNAGRGSGISERPTEHTAGKKMKNKKHKRSVKERTSRHKIITARKAKKVIGQSTPAVRHADLLF